MFSAPHLGGRTSPSPVLRQILWIPSSSGNGALAEPRCFSWSGSTNLPDGRTQSGFLSLFDGSNASSSASVSSSLIPEAGSSSSSPWLMGECNLIFWCHPFRISLDPRGSVRIFLLHSQRSNRLAITRQWNELPSAAIRCTSSISFSSGVPPFFLNKALVCPLWKPINLSLSSADATLISSPPLRLIKNCAWYVYGGNFILSLRHLCSVPSSHCFIPAGLGGGRRRGIALVKVGSFAWSSISAAGHPHPSSHTRARGSRGPSNTTRSQADPASRWSQWQPATSQWQPTTSQWPWRLVGPSSCSTWPWRLVGPSSCSTWPWRLVGPSSCSTSQQIQMQWWLHWLQCQWLQWHQWLQWLHCHQWLQVIQQNQLQGQCCEGLLQHQQQVLQGPRPKPRCCRSRRQKRSPRRIQRPMPRWWHILQLELELQMVEVQLQKLGWSSRPHELQYNLGLRGPGYTARTNLGWLHPEPWSHPLNVLFVSNHIFTKPDAPNIKLDPKLLHPLQALS